MGERPQSCRCKDLGLSENGWKWETPKSVRGQNDLIWGPRLRCPRVWDTCALQRLNFHTCADLNVTAAVFEVSWIRCARPWGPFAPIARKTCIGQSRKRNGSAATAKSATPHTIPKERPDGNLVNLYHFMMSERSRSTRLHTSEDLEVPELQFLNVWSAAKWLSILSTMCLFCRVLLPWEGYTTVALQIVEESEESTQLALSKAKALQYMWAKHLQQLSSKNCHALLSRDLQLVCERWANWILSRSKNSKRIELL